MTPRTYNPSFPLLPVDFLSHSLQLAFIASDRSVKKVEIPRVEEPLLHVAEKKKTLDRRL